MEGVRRSNRSRPVKSKKSNEGEKNNRRKYGKKKTRHDELCLPFLQFEKCNYSVKCRKAHLTLLDVNTKTTRLCKNIFPHENELPYCQHMHINLPKHVIFEYLIQNQCNTCTAYNRKCPRIHDFEIKHLLRSGYKVDCNSSDDDNSVLKKSAPEPTINDVGEIEGVFSFEGSWADQVDEEELRKNSEKISTDD